MRSVTRHASTYFSTMANGRPVCSYESKCYRRNPEHFKQVDHPHLDDLLIGSEDDKPIAIPEQLSFQCNNRSLLNEQLQILRKIAAEKYRASSSGETKSDSASQRETASGAASSRGGEISAAGGRDEKLPIVDLTGDDEISRPAKRKSGREMMIMRGLAPDYLPDAGNFLVKYVQSEPYNIFFTAVQKERETWRQNFSVTFAEILDRSLGEIVSSLHLNFVVNVGWLCMQYLLAEQKADMTIMYQHRDDDEGSLPPNIDLQQVMSPYNFGCHHSKMSILQYKDKGVRIIISSANLYEEDWELRTQGLWISPHLPQLPASARDEDGEAITGFKADLIRYFSKYKQDTSKWRSILARADFSSVKVAFVSSAPGLYYSSTESTRWGHRRLAKILGAHAEVPEGEPSSAIVATVSSIGSLGTSYNSWLSTELVASMSKAENEAGQPKPEFKLIYPSIENYKRSFDLKECSCCLSYHTMTHAKQKWIREYMHHWKADVSNRSRAMPHIKTFLRLSADERKVSWLVLGSANVSKAAWGYTEKNGMYKILSYEVGVVFLPKFFNGGTYFPINKADSTPDLPPLPIPYNIPLTPYSKTDEPFLVLNS